MESDAHIMNYYKLKMTTLIVKLCNLCGKLSRFACMRVMRPHDPK